MDNTSNQQNLAGASSTTDSASDEKMELLKLKVEVWKKVIDVQQHFNDIELRIRNYALTLFTAIIAGTALLLKESVIVSILGKDLQAGTLVSFAGVFVLFGFWYMDKFWYHRLLKAAVKHGFIIEKALEPEIPEIKLTHTIGDGSSHKIKFKKWEWKKEIRSDDKYFIFYTPLFAALGILFLCSLWFKTAPPQSAKQPDIRQTVTIVTDSIPQVNSSVDSGGTVKLAPPTDPDSSQNNGR